MGVVPDIVLTLPACVLTLIVAACGSTPKGTDFGRGHVAVTKAADTHGAYPAVGGSVLVLEEDGEPAVALTCSGVLVAPDLVLTAGHCAVVYQASPDLKGYVAFGERLACGAPSLLVEVTEGVAHPQYIYSDPKYMTEVNDVGLFKLAHPVPGIEPMPLLSPAEAEQLKDGFPARTVGFGMAVMGGFSGYKHVGSGSLIRELASTELTTEEPESRACFVDSGGPLIVDVEPETEGRGLRIAGVVSRAIDEDKCLDPRVIYSRVDPYWDFVDAHTDGRCIEDGVPCDPAVSPDVENQIPGDLPLLEIGQCAADQDGADESERDFVGCGITPARSGAPHLPATFALTVLLALLWRARRHR